MISTDKKILNGLADILIGHGVRRVVLCPGSRNAPLITALRRREELGSTVIVDERVAGFFALGQSLISGEPVAVVCTSGTALLNLAPATAEAYYRGVPLIVISADRPAEWIDQDDSQTMRQAGAFDRFVKKSYDVLSYEEVGSVCWMANREINDALIVAVSGRRGPVHINIRIDSPLGRLEEYKPESERIIQVAGTKSELDDADLECFSRYMDETEKVMVITGFMAPNEPLNKALAELSRRGNIVVFTETISNMRSERFVSRIDTTLSILSDEDLERMRPDLVITTGGALVSRHVKQYLRRFPPREHWHVGLSHTTVDCFKALTARVELNPEVFFGQILKSIPKRVCSSDYADKWRTVQATSVSLHDDYINGCDWSEMKFFSKIFNMIPSDWNLQISNGTPIRYSQLFDCSRLGRIDSNRGVSGIDGSTSTALGASSVYDGVTLLITGDTSAQYDFSALLSGQLTPRFKMIVIDNSGGGIFRFVESTRDLPEREEIFSDPVTLPLLALTDALDIRYFEVYDEASLEENFSLFATESARAAVMVVYSNPEISSKILTNYFKIR